MTVRITGQTRVKSQTLVNFPPQPALNLNFTQGYANGLNPLPSTVTFTRADTAAVATQVGPNGLLRLAAHNILPSSTFATASTTNVVLTPTSSNAPDGSITASLLDDGTASNTVHQVYYFINSIFVASTAYSESVYVRAGTGRYIVLSNVDYPSASNGGYAVFDLLAGVVTQSSSLGTGNLVSTSIVNCGSGWWRISVTATFSQTSRYFLLSTSSTGTYTPDAAGRNVYTGANRTFYIWGGQLEQNLTPSYYVPTTSAAVYANTPRFDYSPVTLEPLGLLIEESRQNIAFPSVPTSSTWTVFGNATLTPVSEPAPDGSLTTPKFVSATNSTNQLITKSFTVSASTTYTLSCYIKANGYNFGSLTAYGNAFVSMTADLTTGAVTNSGSSGNITYVSSSATSAGNGWWRLALVVTTGVGVTSINVYPGSYTANTFSGGLPTTYAGNGTSGAYFWGVQLEAGSFPTSYIPTTTVAVTRAEERASMTGTNFSSWWNATNGSFYFDGASNTDTNTSAFCFAAHDGTPSNYINNFCNGAPIAYRINVSGSLSVDITPGNRSQGVRFKVASTYKANDAAVSLNGAAAVTDTSTAIPTVDRFTIGANWYFQYPLNGYVSRLQYWPARFTDAQLQLITKG